MRVLVSGSSGLVGRALCAALDNIGHTVIRLVRDETATSDQNTVYWNPESGVLDSAHLVGLGAVVHLAGESIAGGRWTTARKARIRDSRIKGTRLLANALAACNEPPTVLVSASAIGYYGDRGDTVLTEDSPPGQGFLADVCKAWEAESARAAEAGIRVVNPRLGMVLSTRGGALGTMLPVFKLGLGGPLGNGRMWMSWIHLDDLVRVILHCIDDQSLSGPVNAFSPMPITNREFTRTLAHVLGRPAVFPAPAPILRLALGEMADELLLSSVRGEPARLNASGFSFDYPELETALKALLAP